MEFVSDYALYPTHSQRIATEFRVPLFQGFMMPASNVDSETAAMYKQILLRPIRVDASDEPEDVRVVTPFRSYCDVNAEDTQDRSRSGAQAFTFNWLRFAADQERLAMIARHKFLARYE